MLAVKYYYNCSCLYGGKWKRYGNVHPKTELILLFL